MPMSPILVFESMRLALVAAPRVCSGAICRREGSSCHKSKSTLSTANSVRRIFVRLLATISNIASAATSPWTADWTISSGRSRTRMVSRSGVNTSNLESPDVRELDFSIYHPLDHDWWKPVCRTFYGGVLRHWQLWWDYRSFWAEGVLQRRIFCPFGRHQWITAYKRDGTPTRSFCWNCHEHRSPAVLPNYYEPPVASR